MSGYNSTGRGKCPKCGAPVFIEDRGECYLSGGEWLHAGRVESSCSCGWSARFDYAGNETRVDMYSILDGYFLAKDARADLEALSPHPGASVAARSAEKTGVDRPTDRAGYL